MEQETWNSLEVPLSVIHIEVKTKPATWLYYIILNGQFFLTRCVQNMMEVLEGKKCTGKQEIQEGFLSCH